MFPSKCISCDEEINHDSLGLCASCWKKIDFHSEPACQICSQPFEYEGNNLCTLCLEKRPFYYKAYSVFKFNENSKELIHKFKYKDKTHFTPYFADLMVKTAAEAFKDADFIISVPLHRLKLLKRLYNQASLLARRISKLTDIEYIPNLLKRIKYTIPQSGLSKKEREKNVKNAFKIDLKRAKGINLTNKNVILIDDVMTTGATINACTSELLKAGCAKVSIITLAKTNSK